MIYVNIVSYRALYVYVYVYVYAYVYVYVYVYILYLYMIYVYIYIHMCDYIRYIDTEKVDHPISLILNPPIRDLKVYKFNTRLCRGILYATIGGWCHMCILHIHKQINTCIYIYIYVYIYMYIYICIYIYIN